jgi:hypothetical protein
MGKEQEGETRRGRGRKKQGADIVDASRACIRQIRKKMWFEKFYWFVSSSGKLVLGGRDARQIARPWNSKCHRKNFPLGSNKAVDVLLALFIWWRIPITANDEVRCDC